MQDLVFDQKSEQDEGLVCDESLQCDPGLHVQIEDQSKAEKTLA
ncbi:hypothetical protein HNP48_001407 [Acidovorax soli]|uniref:Uncharacterized protein n=1 Tax=Acidovorax soli TaxID=592050 RepID=A0A7X0PBB7_9BURK|nr:hypothetical protein [Acidovorax soli]MBB6558743.1 hypothetical protein [Acidovorax soli]